MEEKTLNIIREDIKEIRNTGFKIAGLAAKCQCMLDNPIRKKHPEILPDADDWTETMTKILECCDHLNFITTEKKGRF